MNFQFHVSSKVFNDIAAINEHDIDIQDIAHSLAHICRFNGHTPYFYSVAEHSVLVMKAVEQSGIKLTASLQLAALLHDAHECYVGDIIRPMMKWLDINQSRGAGDGIRELLKHFKDLVEKAFKLSYGPEELVAIHRADNFMLNVEGRKFWNENWGSTNSCIKAWRNKIKYYVPGKAKQIYLEAFNNVYPKHVAACKMDTRKNKE